MSNTFRGTGDDWNGLNNANGHQVKQSVDSFAHSVQAPGGTRNGAAPVG